MSQRTIALFVGLLALAVLAAGCGGDSDSDSGETTATLTKAEFIVQGDVICKNGEEEVEAEANAYAKENGIDTQSPDPAALEVVVTEIYVPSLRKQADELRQLGLPAGAEEEAEAVLDALDEAIAGLEEDPAAAFAAAPGPLAEASKAAAAFGFKECGA